MVVVVVLMGRLELIFQCLRAKSMKCSLKSPHSYAHSMACNMTTQAAWNHPKASMIRMASTIFVT